MTYAKVVREIYTSKALAGSDISTVAREAKQADFTMFFFNGLVYTNIVAPPIELFKLEDIEV